MDFQPIRHGPDMELVAVVLEGSGMWRLSYDWCGTTRYSYYPRDKFKDELDAFKWWKEQTTWAP
jgi:hypothetical protein